MRTNLWMVVLLAGLMVVPGVMGQENEKRDDNGSADDPYEQFDIRDRQMDVEQRQAQMAFQNEMQEIELEKARLGLERERQMMKPPVPYGHPQGQKMPDGHAAFMLLCAVVNVLFTTWVFRDLRKRNAGSGLWIAITLLAGFFGALVYAVVRLGDAKQGS